MKSSGQDRNLSWLEEREEVDQVGKMRKGAREAKMIRARAEGRVCPTLHVVDSQVFFGENLKLESTLGRQISECIWLEFKISQ